MQNIICTPVGVILETGTSRKPIVYDDLISLWKSFLYCLCQDLWKSERFVRNIPYEEFVVINHYCMSHLFVVKHFSYPLLLPSDKKEKKRCIYLTPPNPKKNWKFKIINRQAMSLNSDKIVMVSYFCPKHARCIMLGYLKFLVCDITLIWNDNLWNNIFLHCKNIFLK